MAAKLSSLFMKARALLDEYSDGGVMIAQGEVIDLEKKFIELADMAHKELYDIAAIDESVKEPADLTSPDDTTQVNYKADNAIIYYAAARLAPFENKELVQYFESKYDELKTKCANKATFERIVDAYY